LLGGGGGERENDKSAKKPVMYYLKELNEKKIRDLPKVHELN